MFTAPVLDRICRESYNNPRAVYNLLKKRGMSVVTLTDHDSIEAAETLRSQKDFFLSEEVTVRMPSGTEMHLGVYGLNERDHIEIQRRRTDFLSLLMYLTERKLFFSVNHVFSGLTGRRAEEDFRWFESYVPAYETRNGKMWKEANASAARLATRLGKIGIAGSDSHAMFGVGLTYTEVPEAQTVDDFFAGLRVGRGRVHGAHGTCGGITIEVLSIVKSLFLDQPWAIALAPLVLLVPAFTLNHWVNEIRFCKKWSAAMESAAGRKRMLWEIDPKLEANWAS
ncbi:MAG TPA: PHP domain-containing protein [Candidatus Angelobacter sp.]|nr:PHP domain-containing protein [Candidatus Angelobacter sp.]